MRSGPGLLLLAGLLTLGQANAKDVALYKSHDCDAYMAQMDINTCTGGNLEAADAALNAVYRQVLASRSDDAARDALRQSERAWIRYRDKDCADEVGPQEGGGSIWPMEANLCLRERTDRRIGELRKILSCNAGVSVCTPR